MPRFAVLLLIVSALAPASGAPFQQPARDGQQPQTGTGRIQGAVLAAGGAGALRGVQVMLSAANPRVSKSAVTDANGRYEFSALPPARYSLSARKPGYVSMRYGSADPLEAGKTIQLAAGQELTGVNFSLPRGSVIAGRVLDEFGEPVLDATVRAMRYQSAGGQRRLIAVAQPRQTDDLGDYRIFGLMPGRYYITAVARGVEANGAEPDAAGEPPPDYAPTFYPGTPDVSGAHAVVVGLGEERSSTNFALSTTRVARIWGTATDSQGQAAAGARIFLARREGAIGFRATTEGRVKADGSFEVSKVAPGSYVMQIQSSAAAPDGTREAAFVPVTVSGSDVGGLLVRTSTGSRVGGTVELERNEKSSFQLTRLEITARLAAFDDASAGRNTTSRVRRDGTFELRGLAGPVLIRVQGVPAAWSLKEVLIDGQDITDTPAEFKAGEAVNGLRVVLFTSATEVAGAVDGCQEFSQGCSVLVYSSDSSRWGPQTRFVRIVRPARDGKYAVRGLPSGGYLAIAIPYVWQGEWYDPDFLEQLRPYATSVFASDNQQRTANLNAVRLSQ